MEDKIVFHPDPWYDCLELLEEAQTVIVLEQKNQLALLQDLLLACRRPLFHVFAASNATQLLDGQNRLLLSGSPLDLIALADLLVSLALSGENRGQHWHVDELTLLDKSSLIPELILLRK